MDRAQRHKEAARPLRLLADDAMLERDAFIEIARLKPSWTETGLRRIAVAQAVTPVSRRPDSQIEAGDARHFPGNGGNDLQALLVEIDQHDIRSIELHALCDEGGHGAGSTSAPATDVRQLDACHEESCSVLMWDPMGGSRECGALLAGDVSDGGGRGIPLAVEEAMRPAAAAKVCAPWEALAADRHGMRAARVEAATAGRGDQAGNLATRLK